MIVMEETLSCQRIVKAFAREEFETNRFRRALEEFFQTTIRRAWLQAAFGAAMTTVVFIGLAGLFWYGGHQVMIGRLTPGTLIAFMLYAMFVASPLGALARFYSDFQHALGASDRIFKLLETAPTIRDAPDAYPLPEIKGQLALKNVTFSYGAQREAERPVLKHVSIELEPCNARHSWPKRRGKDHARQPDSKVLRTAVGHHHHRRPRHCPRHSKVSAGDSGNRAARSDAL